MDTQTQITFHKSEWFDAARELINRSEQGNSETLNWIENEIPTKEQEAAQNTPEEA